MKEFDYFDPDTWDNLQITVVPEPEPEIEEEPEPEPEPEIEEEPEEEPETAGNEPDDEQIDDGFPLSPREMLREKLMDRLPARLYNTIGDILNDAEYIYDTSWRDIPGHPRYEVSMCGQVRKKTRGVLKIRGNGSVYIDKKTVYIRSLIEDVWPGIILDREE